MDTTTANAKREPSEYQRLIAEHTREIDPRHIEAWMRVEHPTLDGLSREELLGAMYRAIADHLEAGDAMSESLAATFGL
jgi:hypothetical protein